MTFFKRVRGLLVPALRFLTPGRALRKPPGARLNLCNDPHCSCTTIVYKGRGA